MINWQEEFDDAQRTRTANVVCMKWGTLYGPEWVNKLYGMVSRNTMWTIRFVCLTDDPTGIRPEVECLPLPPIDLDPQVGRRWRKLSMYSSTVGDLKGMTLYLDLDLLIVGNIDELFERPGRFCMMQIWRPERYKEKIGNSSVVRYFIGAEDYILERFRSGGHAQWAELYGGLEQRFVSDTVREITFYPAEWCASFKDLLPRNGLLRFFSRPRYPRGAKVLVFSGLNTPTAAMQGRIDPTKSPDPRKKRMRFSRRFRPADWIERAWAE